MPADDLVVRGAQRDLPPSSNSDEEEVVDCSNFDLSRSSLEDLFKKKMSNGRVRNLRNLVEKANLPWLWSDGKDVELDISPSEYLVRFMRAYYEKISNERVVLANETDGELECFPVSCRGSARYSADCIDKKERLEKYLKEDYEKEAVVFMAFTLSSERAYDIWEAFEIYRECMNHIASQFQNETHFGYRPNYLWVFEPHESGYPHLHLVVFENNIPNVEKIASWWSEDYTEGKAGYNGVDWERIPTREAYSRVCSYISKYVVKTLTFEDMEASQDSEDLRLFWLGMLWLSGRRSWSYSREIGNVMLYGLVVGWTNSTRFLLGAFVEDAKRFSFVGCFSQVEIDDMRERNEFNFEAFFNSQSSAKNIQIDVWNNREVEDLGGEIFGENGGG